MLEKDGYKIPLESEIIAVPTQTEHYRNKVEFTVGRAYAESTDPSRLFDEGEITVGFNRGNQYKGINFVESPDAIKVNSEASILVAKTFQDIVRQSGLSPYEKNSNQGYWRVLVVRESKQTKEMLVSACVTKGEQGLPDETRKLLAEKLGSGVKVLDRTIVSLSLIKSSDLSGGYKDNDELEVLSGKDSYEEILCGLKFNVSPFAFF